MTEPDEVDVLLHEYDSLRNEIISRTSARGTLVGITLGLGAFAVIDRLKWWRVGVIALGIVIAVTYLLRTNQLIKECAERIRSIEAQVEKVYSKKILVWETHLWERRIQSHRLGRRRRGA
jgi:hypothetical protein